MTVKSPQQPEVRYCFASDWLIPDQWADLTSMRAGDVTHYSPEARVGWCRIGRPFHCYQEQGWSRKQSSENAALSVTQLDPRDLNHISDILYCHKFCFSQVMQISMICSKPPWAHQAWAAMLSLCSLPTSCQPGYIYHQPSELLPAPAWLGNKLHKLIFTTISASNYGFYPPCRAYNPFGELQLQNLVDFMLLF